MIGPIGILAAPDQTAAFLSRLAQRVPDRYSIQYRKGPAGAVGRIAHVWEAEDGLASDIEDRWQSVMSGYWYDAPKVSAPAGTDDLPASRLLDWSRQGRLLDLNAVNGQFCAAVMDHEARRLTLITDRLATFPLHVWCGNNCVVFGTNIYAMLAHAAIKPKADREVLAQLFTMQRTIGSYASIAGVRALPAACIWQGDAVGSEEKQYWSLSWRRPSFTSRECPKALDTAFRAAVQRMTTGQKQGLLLSGGVDSRWILAAAPRGHLDCWTTASYAQNPELELAKKTAELFDARHHPAVVDPTEAFVVHDSTVIESNGHYPASTPFSVFMPRVANNCHSVLSGHGLDYTLRGYYLPTRFVDVAGSRTRLPTLRSIPSQPTGADVLYNLRQGPPAATLKKILSQTWQREFWSVQEIAMQNVLADWLNSDEPYNAWDAFILHAVSKHYAFTGMMSVRAATDLHMPAFDNELLDVYLQMPPSWRAFGRPVLQAVSRLSPEAARLPNANTNFRADLHPYMEIAGLFGRGGLRRLKLLSRPTAPSKSHSLGSWQSTGNLFRSDQAIVKRVREIGGRLDALTFGMFDPDALSACIADHMEGRADHTKLLRQLLTHDAWVREFGIEGFA